MVVEDGGRIMDRLGKVLASVKRVIKNRCDLLAFTIFPFILVLVTEFIHRGSLISAVKWVQDNKNEFFISYLIAVCVIIFFATITKKINLSFFIILSISLIFSLISSIKIKFRGEPLLPWDIILGREAGNIVTHFSNFINFKIIFFMFGYFFLGFLLVFKLPERFYVFKDKAVERAILCFVSVALLLPIYSDKPIPIKQSLGIQSITWDQGENSATNGLVLSFLMNMQWLSAEQPHGYDRDLINRILDKENDKPTLGNNSVNPNIIMIMSEAFWDPTVMEGVSFNRDPLPFFRSLQKKHTSGRLLVPVYGGGTANTEFEVLTGNSMQFLPGGAIAYAQYVRKPMESLASILSSQGYNSIGIHSYHNWFYRRNEVYKNFGFNKFISSEFFIDPLYKYEYIADQEITNMIIEEVEKSKEPVFIHAVTMQNHGPYYAWKNGEQNKIRVEGELSSEAKDILETYAQGLMDADLSLKALVDHFDKSKEPTVIAFFGDHLPMLGEDYMVYRETGFYKNDASYSEYRNMYSVPVVVWSNYPLKKEKIDFNASFLGSYLLSLTNQQGSVYMDFLYRLSKSLPLIPKAAYYEDLFIDRNLLEDYRVVQHDLLLGNGYLYGGEKPSIVNPDYFLGQEKMVLDSVSPDRIKAGEAFNPREEESFLELFGSGFVPGCQIYLNDKPQSTVFGDTGYLTASVPKEFYEKSGQLEIQVKLIDSMGKLIAESNKLTIDILN